MSENVLAVLLAAVLLLAMLLWAPLLSLICPPCSRVLRRRLARTPATPQRETVEATRVEAA